MVLIIALLIGGVVGWLAAALTGRHEGFIGSIAIGIVGAIIGGFLSAFVYGTTGTFLNFTWAGIVWTFIGALILSGILNAVQHRSHRHL